MPTHELALGEVVQDRREKFRAYMKRFNATAPARIAIEEGLVVEDPSRSFYKRLASRPGRPGTR